MEKEKTTINYVMTHSRMPEIILKKYKEFLKIANQGPGALTSFLEMNWNLVKKDLQEKTKYEVLDKEQRIDLYSFQIMVVNTKKDKKILNIIMPPISGYMESRFITVLLEKEPRYFTCELAQSFNKSNTDDYYILGEWKYDKKKDKYNHEAHGKIEEFSMKNYLKKIEDVI